MDIRGERRLAADRERVWNALHDPEVLKASITGCERLEESGPDSYDLTVQVGIAAIRGKYTGSVTMSESQPFDSYRLIAKGSGMAGSAEGNAVITLTEDGDGTLLTYDATVRAQGAMSRLGGRIIGSAARMMADRFFEAFERELEGRTA